jgi:biotin carboxylase
MTRIAIVDGYSTGRVLASTLRARGASCVHVQSSREVPPYFSGGFNPADYEVDLGYCGSLEGLLHDLRALGVDRIVAGTESGVILADTLNMLLGTPGNSGENILARRDKVSMAAAVSACNLAVPAGQVASSVAEAIDWYRYRGCGEVVVKPVDSAGTDNVWFCSSLDELRAASEHVLQTCNLYGLSNNVVLLQERIRGAEFYVNTVSANGIHRIAEMWRYVKRPGPHGAPIYDYEQPVAVQDDAETYCKIRDFTFGVLDALGIRASAAHTEVMLTEAGVILIESAARLGGATIPEVVEKYSGVSQAALFAKSLLDPMAVADFDDMSVEWVANVRNAAFINPVEGLVGSDDWQAAIENLPTAVAVASPLKAGMRVARTVDLITSPGFVYLASDDPAELENDMRVLRRLEADGLYVGG